MSEEDSDYNDESNHKSVVIVDKKFKNVDVLSTLRTKSKRRSKKSLDDNDDEDVSLRDEIVEEVRKEFPARPQGLREEWEEKIGVGRKEIVSPSEKIDDSDGSAQDVVEKKDDYEQKTFKEEDVITRTDEEGVIHNNDEDDGSYAKHNKDDEDIVQNEVVMAQTDDRHNNDAENVQNDDDQHNNNAENVQNDDDQHNNNAENVQNDDDQHNNDADNVQNDDDRHNNDADNVQNDDDRHNNDAENVQHGVFMAQTDIRHISDNVQNDVVMAQTDNDDADNVIENTEKINENKEKENKELKQRLEELFKTLDAIRAERDDWKIKFESVEYTSREITDCQDNLKTVSSQLVLANEHISELVSQRKSAETLLLAEKENSVEHHTIYHNNEPHLRGNEVVTLADDDAFSFFQNENILWSIGGCWIIVIGLYFVYKGLSSTTRRVDYDDYDDEAYDDNDLVVRKQHKKQWVEEEEEYVDDEEEALGGDWGTDWSDDDNNAAVELKSFSTIDAKRMTIRSPTKSKLILKSKSRTTPRPLTSTTTTTTPKTRSSGVSKRNNNKDNIFEEFGMTPVIRKDL